MSKAPRDNDAKMASTIGDVEWLDDSMSPRDLVEALAQIRFRCRGDLHMLRIDSGVRDYLLASIRDRAGRAAA